MPGSTYFLYRAALELSTVNEMCSPEIPRGSLAIPLLEDMDLYEVNEAFAPVPLAWCKALGADFEKLNVWLAAHLLGLPKEVFRCFGPKIEYSCS